MQIHLSLYCKVNDTNIHNSIQGYESLCFGITGIWTH